MTDKVVAFGPKPKTAERRDRLAELEARVAELEAQLAYHAHWAASEQIHNFAYALGAWEFYKFWRAGQIVNGRKTIPISYRDIPVEEKTVFIVGVQKAIEAYVGQTKLGIEMGLHHE